MEPVYQTGPLDYEELMQTLNEEYSSPAEKRYLGELIYALIKAGETFESLVKVKKVFKNSKNFDTNSLKSHELNFTML